VALELDLGTGTPTMMDAISLEQLRQANPAAAALPLLQRLAAGDGQVNLPYHGGRVLRATIHANG
ncbi:MAG TPA: hypothetical protein VF678_08875, partial [bacterium]